MDRDDIQRRNDEITELILINLYSVAIKNEGTVGLSDFDHKNRIHLEVLRVGELLGTLYDYKIEIPTNFFVKLFNKNLRKHPKIRNSKNCVSIEKMLLFIAQEKQFPYVIYDYYTVK